jgi:ABC-type methionine transport system ATPase subunit
MTKKFSDEEYAAVLPKKIIGTAVLLFNTKGELLILKPDYKDGWLVPGWSTGGQRQRVGIARALIKNPHILIFDEATSSLDTENEARIRESIREASIGKTTIIIAHRLATVRDADKIFVFDEGKVVGEGSHDELLHSNEYYQRLVHNQVIMA